MEDNNEITLQEIFMILWQKLWVIALCVVIGGGASFGFTKFMIDPQYTSKVTMFVSSNGNSNNASMVADLNAINTSQKLVNTYVEILKSETVLREVVEKSGLNYTTQDIRNMMSASSVNGTEIFEVKIVSGSAEDSALIANTIAKVAPEEIIRVVKAGSVELIDEAVPASAPSSPNTLLNTIIGIMLGGVLAVLGVLVAAMVDTRIKSEEDLEKNYEIPVLGVIPDIETTGQVTK
ncbi:MAG: YveK family protein [Cellulosilyticaceae bacterium]